MNKLIFATLLFVTHFAISQIEKHPGDFTKVSSYDQIDVLLIASDETKVILSGANSEEVEVVNNNGELKLRMPLKKLLKGDAVSATVYYKEIDAVEANEGSRISSEDVFKGTRFNINATAGSEVKLKLDVDTVEVKGMAGSKIQLDGNAKTQDVVLNSGAVLRAENLITEQTTIAVNAGGEAKINATDLVDAKVRAGGKIMIFGHPKKINKKTIAGGRIIEFED